MHKNRLVFVAVVHIFSVAWGGDAAVAQSPSWLWAVTLGAANNNDYAYSVTRDPANNMISTGLFSGTVDFDPGAGTYNLTTPNWGAYISILDAAGNFQWAYALDSATGRDIAADDSGNIYSTGFFYGTTDFDPGPGVFYLTSGAYASIYITKTNAWGDLLWAKHIGGVAGGDESYGISVGAGSAGGVYITGAFTGTEDFDPDTGVFNLSAGSGPHIFICKLDRSGNFLWAKEVGGPVLDNVGWDVATNPGGADEVCVAGKFYGTVDFDPGAGVYNLTGGGAFVMKLDSAGNFIWAKAINSAEAFALAMDPAGNGDVTLTGRFSGSTDFDPDSTGTYTLTSSGTLDGFILKLNNSGNFVWAKQIGGSAGWAIGQALAIDRWGSKAVYAAGDFAGIVDFDPGPGSYSLHSTGSQRDIFVLELDSSGNYVWAQRLGGNQDDYCTGLVLDGSDNLYMSGYYNSPSMMVGATTLVNSGGMLNRSDIFVAKLEHFVTGIEESDLASGMLIYPNPARDKLSIQRTSAGSRALQLVISNLLGQKLIEQRWEDGLSPDVLDISELPAGIYVVGVKTEREEGVFKVVKE